MRRPVLLASVALAALGLSACAEDPANAPRAHVYHAPSDGGTVAVSPEPGPGAPGWDVYAPPASGTPTPTPPPTPTDHAGGLPPPAYVGPGGAQGTGPSLAPGAMAAGTSDADPYFKSFLGVEPPELPREGTWLNTATPMSLASLRGQAVFLYFSFLKCGACPLMRPHLKHWHEAYGPKGLALVYVDNGRADLLPEVKAELTREGTAYPVFYDTDGKAVAASGVRAFPTAYLIGRDGRVIWEGNPVGIESQVEAAIVRALP